MLLQVKKLTTVFQKNEIITKAVDDVSFEIEIAEIVGLVGQSGSGKTVTALSIMQLTNQTAGGVVSGEILFHHNNSVTDLLKLNSSEICHIRGKDIAMVFQEPKTSLNPVLKCGEQVAQVIMLHFKIARVDAIQKTIDLFNKVELSEPENIFNSYPFQLSGGQNQRVMIAMAIACNPKLLIADEPTSSLDITLQDSILKLLKKLQRESDMSIIFISHHIAVVAQFAERVLVMNYGKIVEQGKVSHVFENPKNAYTKALISCIPTLKSKGKALPVLTDQLNSANPSYSFDLKKDILTHNLNSNATYVNGIMDEPILKIINLKTTFTIRTGLGIKSHEVKAVDDVSFNIKKGETLGLVGESGCGKTTLARSIIRLIEPNAGSVVYDGINLMELDKFELREMRKRIQLIFQNPYASLNPRLTVGDAITEPLHVHRLINSKSQQQKRVIELLDKVNLTATYYNRYPHELSGGQRQRIVIARALALNPELIICDECVSALDMVVQAQILNLMNDLKQEFNLTYIFISHDLNVVNYMSDRVVVMKEGKVAEQGFTADVFSNPKSDYTRRLIDSLPKGITV